MPSDDDGKNYASSINRRSFNVNDPFFTDLDAAFADYHHARSNHHVTPDDGSANDDLHTAIVNLHVILDQYEYLDDDSAGRGPVR